jgi:hypothetical protein
MADSTFEAVASLIIDVFNTEFSAEQFVMIPDELHESLGRTRVDVGIAPVEDIVRESNGIVQETWVEIKFYDLWKQEISPDTQVNPYRITAFADRLRDALRVARVQDPGTGQVWFFDVRRVQYPRDPTGNKSRFVMTVRALGNNNNLIETTG